MTPFVHLHVHTEYSLLDGACRIRQLLSAAKEQGQTAIAITDHGTMFGAVDFYKQAKKEGIHPIIGCEVYVAARGRKDRQHGIDSDNRHLILLCENAVGYQNLIRLVSLANTEGFYGKPRVDHELLEQYHEGLIALSACLAGEIPQALLAGDYARARETAAWYLKLFGREHYYIEVQNHGLPEQQRVLPELVQLAEELGIGLVATNDVHYIEKTDSRVQKTLICIQTGHTLEEENPLAFETDEFYLKSGDEMASLFSAWPQAIENTVKIAERCRFDFEFGKTKLPDFGLEGNHAAYLRRMCEEGLARRYGDTPPDGVRERLNYELSVIERMGYVDYYLIVHDFIHYAKEHGIPVGPGRGSGAGSLAAYCIGITGIDPIKYQLLFERFLNPERVSMPDFDVDFCYVRRQEVIDYVVQRYGVDNVAQIVTFGTLKPRAAVRDVGRVLGMPYAAVDTVAKLIPHELGITLSDALESSPELRQARDSDPKVAELLELAAKVEGIPRHASTHAAGVVITGKKVMEFVPVMVNDGAIVAQYTMTALEELGLLKIDFLGLRNITVIDDTERMVRETYDPDFSVEQADESDPATYQMLTLGQTEGVFQFESAGMKRVISKLHPESIEDLTAVISLYRPGPMKSIDTYVANRHDPSRISYRTPLLAPILDVTYGCLVYQEQVMQVFRELAGYSYGRADIVRRAMSKKKHDVMEQERERFIHGALREDGSIECEGCVRRGVPAQVANEIFDEMTSFASYAFNKSHAAAYATVAYRTAYLKCHYPVEYMAALLTSVSDSPPKVAEYIAECTRMGIRVLPPDINRGSASFTPSQGSILFALSAIKGVGGVLIDSVLREREQNGAFRDFYDFCKRCSGRDFNRRSLESLVKSGALDSLCQNRGQMLTAIGPVMDAVDTYRHGNVEGQIGFFDAGDAPAASRFQMPQAADLTEQQKLEFEKEVTGIYVSGHPMAQHEELYRSFGAVPTSEIAAAGEEDSGISDGQTVRLCGIVSALRTRTTKSDAVMAEFRLEDVYGAVTVVAFPKSYAANAGRIRPGQVLCVIGRVSVRDEGESQVLLDRVYQQGEPMPGAGERARPAPAQKEGAASSAPSKYAGLHILVDGEGTLQDQKVKNLLRIFPGTDRVFLKYADTSRRVLLASSDWTAVNETMLRELRRLVGEDHVALVK